MTEPRCCPDDELLLAYVTGSLTRGEDQHVDDHLTTCDRCIDTVITVHARVTATSGDLEPVPPAALRRVHGAPAARPTRPHVPLVLRLPILIPLSAAAGALLVVLTHTWFMPAPPRLRAVRMQRTTQEIVVRTAPDAQAALLGTLPRGVRVEIRDERAGWCRVALPDGREGWTERDALD